MLNVKLFFKQLLIYAVIFVICTALYISLFHTSILKDYSVLMYKGILFIVVCGLISSLLMFLAKKYLPKFELQIKDIIVIFIIFCCVNVTFFTMVPVTVERSVSVFMLSYMEDNKDKAFTEEEIRDFFIDKYVDEYQAFDKRFNEQIVSGNIRKVSENGEDKYIITNNGGRIVSMFRALSTVFNTDKKLVYSSKN